jgi:hypothetical protein
MKKSVLVYSLLLAVALPAAPLVDEPVAELRMQDGTRSDAIVRSLGGDAVLLQHAQGVEIVAFSAFPAEYRRPLEERRQAQIKNTAGRAADVSYRFPPPPTLTPAEGEEARIAGRVFVNTTDAGDLKLSGVRVFVYSKEDYRKQAAWYSEHPWEASRSHSRNAEELAREENSLGAMQQFEAATEIAALGWRLVTPSPFSAVTDAEGRFSITHRVAPPYFVVAHASREVDGEVEYYRWAVISDQIDDPENVLLFNDNMD